LETSGNLIAA